jgi:hypothetical protein
VGDRCIDNLLMARHFAARKLTQPSFRCDIKIDNVQSTSIRIDPVETFPDVRSHASLSCEEASEIKF